MISKKCFSLIFLFFSAFLVNAQEGMQFFQGSWAEVKAEAKKQNKPIFMDAFTTWCGPCKRMAANVFPNPQVGKFYNANFINYKLDMEKGEGPEIAKQFKVEFYPTYLFFTKDGDLMHRAMGQKGPEDFIKDGKTAIDPNSNLYGQINRFKNGDRSPEFIQSFLKKLGDLDANMQKEVLDIFWKDKKLTDLLQEENWAIFSQYDNDLLGERYKYVFENRKTFSDKFGAKEVEGTLVNKAGPQMQTAISTLNQPLYNQIRKVLLISDNKEIKGFTAKSEVLFLLFSKDFKNFNIKAPVYVKDYIATNADELHTLAYTVYQNTEDKEALKNAELWVKKSVDIKKSYGNTGTYAAILYKNKKYKEAETVANDAIKLAQNSGEDAAPAKQLLEMIRKDMKQ